MAVNSSSIYDDDEEFSDDETAHEKITEPQYEVYRGPGSRKTVVPEAPLVV